MTAIELIDSKSFCRIADAFADQWKSTDESIKCQVLEAFINSINGTGVAKPIKTLMINPPQAHIYDNIPEGRFPNIDIFPEIMKAEKNNVDAAMTSTETAKYAAMAEAARLATVPAEVMIQDFITNNIKPQLAKGIRTYQIPLNYKGRVLSLSEDRWKAVLMQEGINFNDLDWSYPTVTVEQSLAGAGIPDDHIPLTLV